MEALWLLQPDNMDAEMKSMMLYAQIWCIFFLCVYIVLYSFLRRLKLLWYLNKIQLIYNNIYN